jgi:PAS domain S-box-containing protein
MEVKKIKVLLIEDNPDDVELIRRKLERSANAKFSITSVTRLHDGLEHLARNKTDLILSDLGLPDSHGLDTVTKILLEVPNIPLVVLSGFDDEAIAIKAVQSGAQDYMVKGQLEGTQIERSLSYAIERTQLQKELEQYTQEISKVQANLHKILEKNADAIVVVSGDRKILFANPAAEFILGHKQRELLNKSFDFPLDAGKTSEIEITQHNEGKITTEINTVKIDWEGKPAYLASMRNITKRKRAEEALRLSEDRYRNIVELAHDGIITVNTKGVFTSCNPAFLQFIGFPGEEIIGKHFTKIPSVNMKDIPIYTKVFASLLRKKNTQPFELSWRHKDGTIKTCELRASLMKSGGKITGLLAIIIDMTERKKSEQALRESEAKFSKAFQHSPEVIVISSIEEGTIFEANDTFLRLTGYTREEVIGKKSSELVTWAVPEERSGMVKTLREKGMVSNEEFHFRMKSGQIGTWLFSAELITIGNEPCILSVTTDITERKKVEEELRFSDTALKSIHEGVFAMDNEFTITRWNKICEQMFGIKASEAIGKSASEIINMVEEYPGQNEERVNLLISQGFNREEQIYRTPRGDVWVDVHAQAIEDNGKRHGWVTLVSDIADRKKVEETLRFSDAAFKSIHESVIATDTKYVITHWNQISEQIYGIKASEAIGKKLLDVIEIVETRPGENDKRFQTLEANGYYQEEQLHRTRQGEIWVDVSLQAIEGNGKRYGWVTLASAITQRKLAEEALKRSEEKYRELIRTSIDGIVSTDSQMRIIIWNRGAEKIFGYKEKEMLGQSIMKIISEKHGKAMAKRLSHISKTGSGKLTNQILELTSLRKDGTDVPIELSMSSRKTGEALIATAIIRDITERKEAEEKLRESEERYRDLFENASDLIQSCNADGKLIYVNKAWRDALGYKAEEITGLLVWDIIHHDYLRKCKDTFRRVMSGESVYNVETIFVAKDGKLIQVEGNVNSVFKEGKAVATRAIFRDITVRKEAEEKLRESEERYRDLFENASDFIQSVNLDGHFVYVNKAWRQALGYTEKEIAKLTIWDIIHPDHLQHCQEIFQRVIAGEANSFETAFVAKNGKVIYVEGNANTYLHDGKITATRGIFHDITERKEAEEKLRKIDQMKSEFLSNVSHELRTPLQSISGFTKLIMNGQVPDPATQQEFFQIIDRETMHLGNLINGLLDMSRLEAGRFQLFKKMFPIRETFTDSIKMFHSLASQKNITLSENIPLEIPEMEVDSERMREVVINLIGNAIKFSDPGGSVNIKVEKQPGNLLFQVSDHGTGISDETMKHLFERFYRAEGETVRGGTGLGLYISKQIIDAHGGHIWAESKFGEGSTFSFTLPLNGKGGNDNGKENSGHRRRPGNIETGRLLPQA